MTVRMPDGALLRDGAFHLANFMRPLYDGCLEDLPGPTAWVAALPLELPPATWARIDALDAESPPYARETYVPWVINLKRRLRGLLEERGNSMPWVLKDGVQRAIALTPIDEKRP